MTYKTYSVSERQKAPLLHFIVSALTNSGCCVLKSSSPATAPFRITFDDPAGQRQGIVAYAFYANSKVTKNRPEDEHRFQIKYGQKDGQLHEIWQDPYELYTTLMLGIDSERQIFVGIDPVLHQLTKFFISVEFRKSDVEVIQDNGWHCWERSRRSGSDAPIETMVGGRPERFLDFVRFEQAAKGLDQGHRFLLAEKLDSLPASSDSFRPFYENLPQPASDIHALASEFEISQEQILNMIDAAPRLKMAVRGWVAEHHLGHLLASTPGIDRFEHLEADGRPDFEIFYRGCGPFQIECKNVLRKTLADGTPRVDFQRTRASKSDPCSRFYHPSDFEILAACLHPCTECWDFAFELTRNMERRTTNCPEHLQNNVRVTPTWRASVNAILDELVA